MNYNLRQRQVVLDQKIERAEDMRRRYLAGETLQQIGEHYGVTHERVRQILKREFGMGPLPAHRREPKEEAILRLHDEGMPISWIMHTLETTRYRVNMVLKRNGRTAHQAHAFRYGPMAGRVKTPPEVRDQIMYAYGNGDGSTAIARRHGVATSTIERILHGAGVLRPRLKATPEVVERITRLNHEEHLTAAEIAADVGMSPAGVTLVMRREGIENRGIRRASRARGKQGART